jgi:pilus assembly protein TadC
MADDRQINLEQFVKQGHKYDLTVASESPEDAKARRDIEAADARQNRRLTLASFVFALAMVVVVFGGCVYMLATGSNDDKKWAAGIVGAIASGLVGFLLGQGRK